MKLLLIGGWGYGNIGDDLILNETCRKLKENLSSTLEINVLSYQQVEPYAPSECIIHKSLHSEIDFGISKFRYQRIGKNLSIYKKIKAKLLSYLIENAVISRYLAILYSKKYIDLIKSMDYLVVCGGGYFNERWISMTISVMKMIELAVINNIKVVILAPTIGNFNSSVNERLRKILTSVSFISVRDLESVERLKRLGLDADYVPDIALRNLNIFKNVSLVNSIGIIITINDEFIINRITAAISLVEKSKPVEVSVIVTRLWKLDFESSFALLEKLEYLNINAKLVILTDPNSLELEISKCDVVISQNLHGMIMAVCSGIPSIALNFNGENSPNYIKIKSFLMQVGLIEYECAFDSDQDFIADRICSAIVKKSELRSIIQEKIELISLDQEKWIRKAFALIE